MDAAGPTYEVKTYAGAGPLLVERDKGFRRLVQSGRAVGLTAFPVAPQPILPGQLADRSTVKRELAGAGSYAVSWTHAMFVADDYDEADAAAALAVAPSMPPPPPPPPEGGHAVSVEMRFKLVTFRPENAGGGTAVRLSLTLRGGWSVSPGLAPDVNVATVPRSELAKLGGVVTGVRGAIEFWYSSAPPADGETTAPDVSLASQQVVEVTPVAPRGVAGEPGDVVYEYAVSFADFRHAYVEPRGGRVFRGEVNPEPAEEGFTPATNGRLVDACLAAIGGAVSLPVGLDDVEPARKLSWHGAHAPTELSKLLQHCGACFCPSSLGLGTVEFPGQGLPPTIPAGRLVSDVTSPAADRRARQIALVSSPTAVIESFDENAPNAPAWKFVAQDAAGVWKPLADLPDLGGDPARAVRDGFAGVPEASRERMRKQVYRYLQLDAQRFDPRQSPVLATLIRGDGPPPTQRPPYLKLVQARPVDRDRWVDQDASVEPQQVEAGAGGNRLYFAERVGRVASASAGAEAADPDAAFVAIPEGQIKVAFSVEAFDGTAGRREVFSCGFLDTGTGDATPVPAATAAGWLEGYQPDTACYCEPSLRLVRQNGADANRADLEGRAITYARPLVANNAPRRTLVVKGYLAVEVGRRVSGVR